MMKNLITKTLAFGGLMLLVLASCKKDGDVVTVSSTGTTASTLTASTTTPVLTKATLTATSVTFTGTAPSYGYSAAVTNTLQFDLHSDNFATTAKIKDVTLAAGVLTQTYNVQDFNNLLLAMGLPTGVSAQVDVRVKSSLSSTAGIVYSNVVTLTVTPFALVSYVYVPGAYQGWNPATADSLQSATGNGVYTGIINFTAGNNQFLITPVKNWNNKYATNDAASTGGTSSNYTVTYNGSNNFYAPTIAGWYQVTLNTNNNTITIVPANYYSIIGDAALGWGTDTDMKFDNGRQLWTVTTALTSTGGYKVRRNHDWGTSYGWPTTTASTTLTSASGNNMSVSLTGTYFITFGVSATDATVATLTATKQ